jgi:peptide/nickel transport system permease protein
MKYILKKIAAMLVTLMGVSFLVFLAFSIIPGDPAQAMLGTEATPERLAALQEQLGLNRPFLVRYVDWLFGFLHGDFGVSYSYQIPVGTMIWEKFPVTFFMSVLSFVFMLIISIPLGIYTAKHKDKFLDRIIYMMNQVIMSVPPFFMGILFTLVFGLIFRLFTPGGYIALEKDPLGFFLYLCFPALSIALPKSAMAIKMLRSSVIEQSKLDYVRTAYSRGNTIDGVLYSHVLKNALIPVITFWGMAFVDIMAGSIIVEQVFGIPGLGRILLTSISNRDYPVVEGIIMLLGFFVIVINFLVDIIYRRIDPRIKEAL